MINAATADITGGHIGQLVCRNTSSVDVYSGSVIDLLKPDDFSVANVYDCTTDSLFSLGNSETHLYKGTFDKFHGIESSLVNLYSTNYTFNPAGGTFGNGLLTGTWFLSGDPFSANMVTEDSFDHIIFIPEPYSFLSIFLGGMLTIKRKK